LSNRKRFKTFFRTHPTAILDNPARLELCKKYKWKKIATLQNDKEVFTSTVDNLEKEAKQFDIEILVRQTFTDDPTDAVRNLKKQDARIIVGVFYEDEARKVFCQAYKEGMLFPKYIWMIIGWYSENWYLEGDENEIKCNKTEMKIAVYGHLTTEVQFFTNNFTKKQDYGIVIDFLNIINDSFKQFILYCRVLITIIKTFAVS
jgi:gamma-aminobutyric acid type B receptor